MMRALANNVVQFPARRPVLPPLSKGLIDLNQLLTSGSKDLVIGQSGGAYYLINQVTNAVEWEILPGDGREAHIDAVGD